MPFNRNSDNFDTLYHVDNIDAAFHDYATAVSEHGHYSVEAIIAELRWRELRKASTQQL